MPVFSIPPAPLLSCSSPHRSCVSQLFSALLASLSQVTASALASGMEPPNPMAPNALSGRPDATPCSTTANNSLAQGLTVSGGKLVHMYKWDAAEARS